MAEVCDCGAGLSNTGLPGCVPIQGVTSSLILVPIKDNDGVKNGIDLTVPFTGTTWSDHVNEPDESKRWFPLPAFEDVTLPKADSQFAEAASGRKAKLRQGKRSFEGALWEDDSSPEYLGKLIAAACVKFGFYYVDVNGNLIGSIDGDFLRPIPADNASWDPKLMFAEDDQVSHILVAFDWDRLFKEETMRILTAAEAGQNFTELEGLQDVTFENEAASAASQVVSFDAELGYSTAGSTNKYQGAILVPDWEVLDPLGLPLTVLTADEITPGQYDLTLAALSFIATDELTVSVTKAGFSGSFSVIAGA